jgi:hypothetical protein
MRLAGHVAYIAELRHKFSILFGTRGGTDPLRNIQHRWEDNIKICINKYGLDPSV